MRIKKFSNYVNESANLQVLVSINQQQKLILSAPPLVSQSTRQWPHPQSLVEQMDPHL